ncbi:MAG: PVC-type heme-binding CxxCH protein [Pirellulales bacterium]
MRRSIPMASLLLSLFTSIAIVGAAEPVGQLPRGIDGQPLNLDFEKGTLLHWMASGDAFAGQPVRGDTVTARGRGMNSRHAGQFWVGGFEMALSDAPQGMLTSAPFKVTLPYASFRVAGGSSRETRVELVRRDTNKVIFACSGDNTETLKPIAIDLRPHIGREIFIRLVDASSGDWGHVNFDDFRVHAKKPDFPQSPGEPPADEYTFAGLSAEKAAGAMVVPEGFKVTLAAGEPDVMQPIAMAIDDRGRLWIAEAYTYPIRAPEGKGKDRILIFEDADGDGRLEKRKVFVENLNLVSGLEVGFGGVWIGAAPYLLFVPDRDHDDVPDGEPEVLLDGWGYHDTHETLNALTWGPDGWLYGCHGVFTHSRVGKPGTPDARRVPINAGIWRYHPTRHEFEVFAHGTSNPWGVDFNDLGQAFCTACVIPHLFHVIQGGRYQRQAGAHFNRYTYDDIQTIARHRHWIGDTPHSGNNRSDAAGGGHAHAGAMIYLGGSWPEKYRNQIFMNNIHGQRLNEDLLSPKGSGYEGNRAPDFCLARDNWSQIINLQYGPDGQMWMIDWYDANACHHRDPNGHDRTNGRIFKVSYQNAKPAPVDLQKLSDDDLAALELNPNDWYVRHARRILQERGPNPAIHKKLSDIALEHPYETRRVRAMWALHASGGFDEKFALACLRNEYPHVRAWAIQLLTDDPAQALSPAALDQLARLAEKDDSPVVRLYISSALQKLPLDQRWAILPGLLAHSEDAADHNLPLMYWYAAEPLAEADAARALRLAADGRIPLVFSYMTRRVANIATPEALDVVVAELGRTGDADTQFRLLSATSEGLTGRRRVTMPKRWADYSQSLVNSPRPEVNSLATALALKFGDPQALAKLRGVLVDSQEQIAQRKQALDALLGVRDPGLAATLQKLIDEPPLRGAALRGLAAYDDGGTPSAILAAYPSFNLEEKRDALNTLAARVPYATALLAAVGEKKVPATDLAADLIRQLRNHKNDDLDDRITKVWGTARESTAEKAQLIAQYTRLVKQKDPPADASLGRAVFVKTCQQCHTLFGTGGKIGPELTGSNRANLDYLLSNMLDPSAVMAKEYQPSVIVTSDGRVITGIVKSPDADALTVQTANELVVLPRGEIDQVQQSDQSMMPDDLLKQHSPAEVRSLVAYLAGSGQVPTAATADNVKTFFNGADLSGWQGNMSLWSVEDSQIVGRTSGLKQNEFLKNDLAFGDFRLRCRVQLVDNLGNSGIQFRSEAIGDGLVKGYQADIGAGWWGKLYEEHGRALLWPASGEAHVKPGWNTYEVLATGDKIQTRINGQLCVDLVDPAGAKRGIIALQLHSGGPTEVRYKDFEIELDPKPEQTKK